MPALLNPASESLDELTLQLQERPAVTSSVSDQMTARIFGNVERMAETDDSNHFAFAAAVLPSTVPVSPMPQGFDR